MRLRGIVLESLDEDVLARIICIAEPVEPEATRLLTGSLGELRNVLAEVLDVLV